jgi:hypothetical protein
MHTLLRGLFVVILVALPAGLAQARDRDGSVSFGIVITNDRDGRYDHDGRYGRYDRNDRYDRHRRYGYGHGRGYGDGYGRDYGLHGCHVERSFGYHHGRRAEIGTTVCYDRFGRPVALANSSYVIRYRYGY